MSLHFEIEFNHLNEEQQEIILDSVKEYLFDEYVIEGKEFLKEKKYSWHVTPKTWQEAFCRVKCIEYKMWDDLDEKSKEFKEIDWPSFIDDYMTERAYEKCYEGMEHLEIEIKV